jgi:hypothetical protein
MAGVREPRIVVGVTDSVGSRWALAGDLLVIGSSGRLAGPTRRYCARRTRCPLVVVPQPNVGDLLGAPFKTEGRAPRSREVR